MAAQTKLAISFPQKGKYRVWIAAEFPPAPYAPQDVESDAFTLDVPKPIGGEQVFVWDLGSGNLASKPVKELGASWKLAKADFNRVGRAVLRVEHAGKPVNSANVTVRDRESQTEQLIDPSANGELELFGLRHGEVKAEVSYRTPSGMASPLRQSFEFLAERSQPEPVFVVAISEPVATLDGPEEAKPKSSSAQPSGLATFFIALLIASIVGFFAWRWMLANKETVKTKLDAMGVPIPEPEPDEPADVDLIPPAPAPQQPIVLSAPVPVAAQKTGVPRLVEADGSEFNLPQGTTTIGRDVGVDLIIPQETTVSRKHASIEVSGSTTLLRDLGSTNGTFVNGARVSDSAILRGGDEIRFGKAVFRYEE